MYDVIVIGAGPAGSAAAYYASRAGLRVLIADRQPFPRSKTCGDALTPRAVDAVLRMGVTSLPGDPIYGLRIVHTDSGHEWRGTFPAASLANHGVVVVRDVLDAMLLDRARIAGAEVRTARATGLVRRHGRVTGAVLRTATETIRVAAKVVVVATGSSATAALRVGRRRRLPAWGVAGRLDVDLGCNSLGRILEFHIPVHHDGHVVSAYAWVFPAGPHTASIGVGAVIGSHSRHTPVRLLIRQVAARLFAEDPRFREARACGTIRTAPIAGWPLLEDEEGLLAVGDAAGLAHPLTGEGITAALESGELAAHAIATGDDDARARYAAALARRSGDASALRPALAAIHRRPWIALGRGWDLMIRPTTSIAQALHKLLSGENATDPWLAVAGEDVRAAMGAVRDVIDGDTRRLPPLVAELMRRLCIESPQFGWCTTVAATARAIVRPTAPRLRRGAVETIATLEMIHLIGVLHAELRGRRIIPAGETAWGRNTAALLLADCLNAVVLQRLYTMTGRWRHTLTHIARGLFRDETRRRIVGATAPTPSVRSASTLLDVAVLVGTDEEPPRTPEDCTALAARRLTRLEAEACDATRLRVLARGLAVVHYEPLRIALRRLISIAIDRGAPTSQRCRSEDPCARGASRCEPQRFSRLR